MERGETPRRQKAGKRCRSCGGGFPDDSQPNTGSPLELAISDAGERVDDVHVLGPDLAADHKLQVVVPKNAWQTARWVLSLVSRTHARALSFLFLFNSQKMVLVGTLCGMRRFFSHYSLSFFPLCAALPWPRLRRPAHDRVHECAKQILVHPFIWRRPLGGWALVSCMMAPQFAWSGFTLAPPGWMPGTAI